MDLFNEEDYKEVIDEMDAVIEDIEKDDELTNEEIKETIQGLEIFIEKCQQIHTVCRKRLKAKE